MLINLELLFSFMTLFYISVVLFMRLKFQQWCCVILLSKHYTSEFPIKILHKLHFSMYETRSSDLILGLVLNFSWRWILSLRPSLIWRWVIWVKEGGTYSFLKTEAARSFKMSVTVYQAIRRHIPEDRKNIHFYLITLRLLGEIYHKLN